MQRAEEELRGELYEQRQRLQVEPATGLRARYGMSGADVAYGAMQSPVLKARTSMK